MGDQPCCSSTLQQILSYGPILIVEDSESDRLFCRELLVSFGIKSQFIIEAKDLRSAAMLIARCAPTICLLDHRLPDGAGLDLLQLVHCHNLQASETLAKLNVIMMTGAGSEQLVMYGYRAGIRDYLPKSDLNDHLLAALERLAQTRHQEHIERHSQRYDTVTGLMNRSNFLQQYESIKHTNCRYTQFGNSALLFIDLDGFKTINSNFGHAVGDRYLRLCAERISLLNRSTDLIARFGGDEFVVYLDSISRTTLMNRLNTWFSEIRTIRFNELDHVGMGCSIGVALIDHSDPSHTLSELLRRADIAKCTAKKQGKQRYVIWQEPAELGLIKNVSELKIRRQSQLARQLGQTLAAQKLASQELKILIQSTWHVDQLSVAAISIQVVWKPLLTANLDIDLNTLLDEGLLHEAFYDWLVPELLRHMQRLRQLGFQGQVYFPIPCSVLGCRYMMKALRRYASTDQAALFKMLSLEFEQRFFQAREEFCCFVATNFINLRINIAIGGFGAEPVCLRSLKKSGARTIVMTKPSNFGDFVELADVSLALARSVNAKLIVRNTNSEREFEACKAKGVKLMQGEHFKLAPCTLIEYERSSDSQRLSVGANLTSRLEH